MNSVDCDAITHGKRYIEVCCCGDCPYLQNFGGAASFRDDYRCGNQEVQQSQKIDGKFLTDGFPDFCPIEKNKLY